MGYLVNKEYEKEHRRAVQNYMDYLAEARPKFEAALEALNKRDLPSYVRLAAKGMAHKIAGNALMYGFPELGDIASQLENYLISEVERNIAPGQSLCLKIIQEIDTIRDQVNRPAPVKFESDTFQQDPTPDRWKMGSIETEGYGLTRQMPSVLFVHSDPVIGDLFRKSLSHDHRVTLVDSAHQAMAFAVNNKPDMIVTEQKPGDMSGTDMTRFIRNVDGLAHIPVIMIMSSDQPEDIVAAVQAGVTDCFDGTQDSGPILAHIRDLLQKTQNHVLIIDDDRAVRDLLKSRFEAYGLRVNTAADGIEGLEFLRQQIPDLIILDRMMPRLEGGAVLYQIQQEVNLKSIPVMLVTAMTNRDDVITWLERGATDYITKPFNPDEVVLRAMRHLRMKKNAA